MSFTSIPFLMMFLPITVLIYVVSPKRLKNLSLVICGGIFSLWGDWERFWTLPAVIAISFVFGIIIESAKNKKLRELAFWLSVILELAVLCWFKYGKLLNRYYYPKAIDPSTMPTGLSFLVFFAVSYLADIYSGKAHAQNNPINTALYLSFFPSSMSGPIDLYRNSVTDILSRKVTLDDISYGCKRFVIGLGKKVILADYFGLICSRIYSVRIMYLPGTVLWLGIILFALQIYYDFSGYSDMAVGLGRIFGFHLSENFSYPYMAESISDFWRKWHISLSTWFREYVYIPLGGNRKGTARTVFNLLIVFFLTGIWHGSGATFVLFGLWHGICVIADRFIANKLPKPVKRALTLAEVLVGWVLFRSSSVTEAAEYFGNMLTFSAGYPAYRFSQFFDIKTAVLLLAAVLGCGVIQKLIPSLKEKIGSETEMGWGQVLLLLMLFFICLAKIIAGTYNAFIYFQF